MITSGICLLLFSCLTFGVHLQLAASSHIRVPTTDNSTGVSDSTKIFSDSSSNSHQKVPSEFRYKHLSAFIKTPPAKVALERLKLREHKGSDISEWQSNNRTAGTATIKECSSTETDQCLGIMYKVQQSDEHNKTIVRSDEHFYLSINKREAKNIPTTTTSIEDHASVHVIKTVNISYHNDLENKSSSEMVEDVVLQIGDLQIKVCEENMLCRKRCMHVSSRYKRYSEATDEQTTAVWQDAKDSGNFPDEFSVQLPRDTYLLHNYGKVRKRRFPDFRTKVKKKPILTTNIQQHQHQYLKNSQNKPYSNLKHQLKTRPERDTDTELALCPNKFPNETCFCDQICVVFGDCCPDVFEVCFHLNDTDSMVEFISDKNTQYFDIAIGQNTETYVQNAKSLIPNLASCILVGPFIGFMLVSRCPEGIADTYLREQCENSSSVRLPPVSVALPGEEVSFRNVYCALCHDIAKANMMAWPTNLSCNKHIYFDTQKTFTVSDFEEFVKDGTCNRTFTPPKNICKPRQCDPDSRLSDLQKEQLSRGITTGQCTAAEAILCQAYFYPHEDYKNKHCAKCLETVKRERREVETYLFCDAAFGSKQAKMKAASGFSGGIMIILDMTGTYSGENGADTTYVCLDVEVYDPLTQSCRSLVCPRGSQPYRGQCLETPGAYFFDGASQVFPKGWEKLVIRINTQAQGNNSWETNIKFINSSNFVVESLQKINDTNNIASDLPTEAFLKSNNTFFSWNDHAFGEALKQIILKLYRSGFNLKNENENLTQEIGELPLSNGTYYIFISNIMNLTSNIYKCPNGDMPSKLHNFSLVENGSVTYVVTNISLQSLYYPFENVGFDISWTYNTDIHRTQQIMFNEIFYVCNIWMSFRENCTLVTYWLNETLQNGSRLLIVASGQYYDEGDFQMKGDQVLVCSNFQFEIKVVQPSLPYLVLSWLFSSLSIVFLLLMLIIYFLFPKLRTLPGKMTASLAATMMLTFLSNLFTLVELHHDYVCPCVAALSHLVTLAHFGWMSAIAVNMALTFGPLANTLVKSVNDKTAFLRYSLVVWGVSLCIVLTSVILDLTHRDLVITTQDKTLTSKNMGYPLYGYPFCTWFSGPLWTKLAFVILPYFITFIVNIVGFTLTLIGIQQAGKISEKLGKKSSEKARCLMYIKLSSAMGFSWFTSALVNIYPSSPVLPYIYLCLVLLQGVLLFLSFMVNQRVHGLLLRKFGARLDKLSQASSTQDSYVTTK